LSPSEIPILAFPTPEAWWAWLLEASEAGNTEGLWLKLAKQDSGVDSVSYPEAIEAALRVGWIDGQKRGLDDRFWLQRFTPRRQRSRWSKINREKAEHLIECGLMMPAGLREVEQARADGRWDAAYAGARTIEVPDDLRAALAADPVALAFFEALDGANRYAILYRVHDAKRSETRARRIAQFVTMCREGRTVHPPRARR
jgi:uncharacterized protein YdeI (YjbR/CyaY-like superfamily)